MTTIEIDRKLCTEPLPFPIVGSLLTLVHPLYGKEPKDQYDMLLEKRLQESVSPIVLVEDSRHVTTTVTYIQTTGFRGETIVAQTVEDDPGLLLISSKDMLTFFTLNNVREIELGGQQLLASKYLRHTMSVSKTETRVGQFGCVNGFFNDLCDASDHSTNIQVLFSKIAYPHVIPQWIRS